MWSYTINLLFGALSRHNAPVGLGSACAETAEGIMGDFKGTVICVTFCVVGINEECTSIELMCDFSFFFFLTQGLMIRSDVMGAG